MWFDQMMDDCKQALRVAVDNKGVFIPILVKAGFYILFFIFLFVGTVVFMMKNISKFETMFSNFNNLWSFALSIFLGLLIIIAIYTAIEAFIEAGSVNLYKLATEGIKPRLSYFFEGIKKYFGRIFAFSFAMHSLLLIFMPFIVGIFIVYALTIGVLTAGWGVSLISVLIGTYLNIWTIALVVHDMRPLKAVITSMKFGHKNFWTMFLLTLSSLLITQYMVNAFGILIAFAAGWLINGVLITYFKLIFMLVYKREYKETNGEEPVASIIE